jgi:hypothetical protein
VWWADTVAVKHILAALTIVGTLVSLVGLILGGVKFHFWNKIKRLEDDFREALIAHEQKYKDHNDKENEAEHLQTLEAEYRQEHLKLLFGKEDNPPERQVIVEKARKKRALTPAIIWGGVGLIIATAASVWSLSVP